MRTDALLSWGSTARGVLIDWLFLKPQFPDLIGFVAFFCGIITLTMDNYQWFNNWPAKFLNVLLGCPPVNLAGF